MSTVRAFPKPQGDDSHTQQKEIAAEVLHAARSCVLTIDDVETKLHEICGLLDALETRPLALVRGAALDLASRIALSRG
jgi:hypothetical protein